MINTMESLYISLLALPNPSAELQERVFAYAKSKKSSKAMLALIRLENLTDELDAKLGLNPSAHVLAEWIARKPRPPEVLEQIVLKAKSQKVLQVLAEQENLGPDVYKRIAEKHDPGSSVALYQNPQVSDQLRLTLGPGLAKVVITKHRQALTLALNKSPDLFESILNAPIITRDAWDALGAVAYIPDEHQFLLIKRLRKDVESGHFAQNYRLDKFAYMTSLSRESLVQLLDVLKTRSASGNVAGSNSAIRHLENILTQTVVKNDLAAKIQRASTQEAFDGLLAKLKDKDRRLAPIIVASPFFNIENVLHLKKFWHYGAPTSLFEANVMNPEAIFILLATFPQYQCSNVIDSLEDPKEMIHRVVVHLTEQGTQIPAWILESPHFAQEFVLLLSPSVFSHPASVSKRIAEVVNEALFKTFKGDESAWDTFESLVGSHEGSIEDLISVVASLCDLSDEESDQFPELSISTLVEIETEVLAAEADLKSAPSSVNSQAILGDPLFEL